MRIFIINQLNSFVLSLFYFLFWQSVLSNLTFNLTVYLGIALLLFEV